MTMITTAINKVSAKLDLTYDEMYQLFTEILDGKVSDEALRQFIVALSEKGETEDEITAIAEVLISHAKDIPDFNGQAMDNCGTGGDRSESFNISTTSAFVLASAGVTIAKHGNKSITSKTGSSDVLRQLGVDLNFDSERVASELNNVGISFLSAPHVHPKMKQIMKVRSMIKTPTVFNFIGPCISPINLSYQFLGVFDQSKLMTIAKVLNRLGRKNAVVINGAGNMDEATLLGKNHLVFLKDGEFKEMELDPTEYGLTLCSKDDIKGGDGEENKEILINILNNKGTKAQTETITLNAGIALYVAEKVESIDEGIELANEIIKSGKAYQMLEAVRKNHEVLA